jgi:hypothetical protein
MAKIISSIPFRFITGLSLLVAATTVFVASAARACDDGYAIQAVLDDGNIIKLDDGSIWRVDPTDAVTASVWLATADVLVCDDEKIISVDDEETVHVHRIR